MSQPQEPKQFKVTITVTDEQGNTLNRNIDYQVGNSYNETVEDLVDSFLEAENL